MGSSTLWVLANTGAQVRAVDTSRDWVEAVKARGGHPDRLKAEWIDVGPLGDWGAPLGYSRRENFAAYREAIWAHEAPDLVLIDGRFRVACLLHCLLRGMPGTKLLFDDYAGRPAYHVVEEFVVPVEACGRQRLFIVPERIDRPAVEKLRDAFAMVTA